MDLGTGDTMTFLGWPDPQRQMMTGEALAGYTRETTAYCEVKSLDLILSSCKVLC